MWKFVILCCFIASALGKYVPTEVDIARFNELKSDDGRVIGGEDADPGEYPSQVTILYAGLHNCGGTIISESWILTAAHCIKLPAPGLMSIRVGTNIWSEPGADHEIISLYPHPNYNFTDFSTEDIGLVEVSPPIVFNNVTQPVKLPEQDQVTPGGSAGVIVGWGISNEGENVTLPFKLQEGFVTVRSYDECFGIYTGEVELTEAQMCADEPAGGVGVCSGDSGGPLYVDGEIVGITSWGANGCAAQGWPAVFTRVASFRDWIREHSGV